MIITYLKSTNQAYFNPDESVDTSWEEIVKVLLYRWDAKNKDETPMFNLWQFKTLSQGAEEGRKYPWDKGKNLSDKTQWTYRPNTIRRCADNTVGLWGIVLDYDGKKNIEQAIIELDGVEAVIYTTFRHSAELDKFRIVIPFTRMMPKEEFSKKLDDMKTAFPYADNASFSASQAIYLHSSKYPELAVAGRLHGNMIDPDIFIETPIIHRSEPIVPANFPPSTSYKIKVLNSLLTCRNVHRGASRGNGGALTAALICKSVQASFNEFQQICSVISAADSCLRETETQTKVWNEVVGDRISKTTREQFILNNGGTI